MNNAAISEEVPGSATFTISHTGGPLSAGNTATVTVNVGALGTASAGVDYTADIVQAIQTAATAANVGFDIGTGVLTFTSASATSFNVTITAQNDNALDSGETVQINLVPGSATISDGNATIGTGSATATITDIDAAVSFAVTADDEGAEGSGAAVAISEENGSDNAATFTVAMGGTPLAVGNSASVVLNFPGTAADGTDYSTAIETAIANAIAALPAGANPSYDAGSNTLTFFGGGPSSLSFVVTATNDDFVESPAETIVVNLTSPTIAEGPAPTITAATATATITDIDAAVSFAVTADDEGAEGSGAAVAISEENGSDNAATFTVAMGGTPLAVGNSASVVLNFPGTAADGTDYSTAIETAIANAIAALPAGANPSYDAGSNTLTFFGGGPSSLSFVVTATNDDFVESPAETIVVNLTSPTIAEGPAPTITAATATATITDIDAAVSFAVTADDEGAEGSGAAVAISEENGSDNAATFTVAMGGTPLAVGNSASVVLNFPGTAADGTDYSTAIETAIANAIAALPAGANPSYDAGSNTLTFFGGGPSSLSFVVTATNDDFVESPAETIVVNLTSPTIAEGPAPTITAATATATITDIDAAVSFAVTADDEGAEGSGAAVAISEENGSDNAATFTVAMGGTPLAVGNSASVVLNFPGTAADGTDYSTAIETAIANAIAALPAGANPSYDAGSNTLTFFGGGPSSLSFVVTATNDDFVESPAETIVVNLTSPTIAEGPAPTITAATATATITDIDAAVSFAVTADDEGAEGSGAAVAISEENGSDNAATFTVAMGGTPLAVGNSASVVLNFPGTAADGTDYSTAIETAIANAIAALPAGANPSYDAGSNTLTFFGGGPSSLSFVVTATNDDFVESPAETIVVNLTSPTIAEGPAPTITAATATATITDIDAAVSFAVTADDEGAEGSGAAVAISEENGSDNAATFTVAMGGTPLAVGNSASVVLNFPGTAADGTDYSTAIETAIANAIAALPAGANPSYDAGSNTLTFFGGGPSSLSFVVTATNDDFVESPAETIVVNLTSPTIAEGPAPTITAATATATITDIDAAVSFAVTADDEGAEGSGAAVAISEENGSDNAATFTVAMGGTPLAVGNSASVVLNFPGTAADGTDYSTAIETAIANAIAALPAGANPSYDAGSNTLTFFGGGPSSLSFVVTATNDDFVESPAETIVVNLTSPTIAEGPAPTITAATATATITDIDAAVSFAVTADDEGAEGSGAAVAISEENGSDNAATFTVAMGGTPLAVGNSASVVLNFPGTAADGTDYSTAIETAIANAIAALPAGANPSYDAGSNTLTFFGGGPSSLSFVVTATNDDFVESPAETIVVNLTSPTIAEGPAPTITAATATATITDIDAAVSFAVTADDEGAEGSGAAVAISEENGSDNAATFTVAMGGTPLAVGNSASVVLNFPGTAADGTDYSTAIETAIANAIAALPAGANPSYDAGSNTLTFFGGGPSSLSFVVTATNDDFVESPAETIVVNLTSPTIAEGPAPTITAATATATITDIDAAVSFAVTADDEGAEGSGAAVAISEENGSDNAATFTVAMGGTPLAVGNSASVVLNFPGTAADGTDYSTAIETAIANAIAALPAGANPSYDAGSNTLTFFGGGPSSLSFVVTATNDDFVESPAETIVVNLTSPTIAEGPAPTITAATATATITDIDAAVSFAVTADDEGAEGSGAAVAISEENGSDNAATFTVAMGGTPLAVGNSASVVLNFPGTAADGTDYSTAIETAIANAIAALPAGANPSYDAGSNTLTFFGGGPSSLSFVVTATNDDFVESPAETIVVNLTSPTIAEGPAPTITAATATATITDIDAAVSFAVTADDEGAEGSGAAVAISEENGSDNAATFTVAMGGTPLAVGNSASVVLNFPGTAADGTDYSTAIETAIANAIAALPAGANPSYDAGSNTLTFFGGGPSSLSFVVTATNDDFVESPAETIVVNLTSPTIAEGPAPTITAATATATITDIDAAVSFAVTADDEGAEGSGAAVAISEENGSDNAATFTVAMGGTPLAVGNSASVVLNFPGTAADGTDYSTAIETAIANAIAALPAGANPSYDAGSNTLTFFGGGPSSLSFVVTATNDDFVESPAETIVVNLTSPTIAEGPAPTITAATATATITDIDAAVSFAVTADDEGAEGSGAAVAISEENGSDNAATFTVAMGGTPLAVGNSASVVLNFPGTAADGTDYSTAIETAIANAIAALPAGANPSYDAGSNTLTFFGGGPSSLSFVVTATNDDFVESPAETIVVNLTSPTIAEGPAPTITAATATATITDIDAAVSFAVTADDEGAEGSGAAVAISEENGSDNAATFTVAMGGTPLAVGNSASVVLNFPGTAADGTDYSTAIETAIANAIAALPAGANPSYDAGSNTLTFFGGGPSSLSFVVTATNDDFVESPAETIVVNLTSPTIAEGPAPTITAATATATITDIDAAVSFAVTADDEGAEGSGAAVAISEENGSDNAATFTVAMGGTPLAVGNSASVVLNFPGTAADGTDYSTAIETAIANAIAALPAGANPSYDAGSNTLTFFGGGPSSLSFVVTATNDDFVESPAETIVVNLTSPTIAEGPAPTITAATATATITDIDAAVSFAVTADDEGAEGSGAAVAISEENGSDNAATFTVAMGGTPLAVGNSASVVLNFPGTAADGTDYSTAIETAIANAIAALPAGANPSYDAGSNTLTFFGGGPSSLSFVVTATNDDFVESPAETIVVNLTSPTIAEGPAPTITAATATATITDIDAAVSFAVTADDEGAEGSGAAVAISEENGSDNAATFTVAMGGTPLAVGNSASVVLNFPGTAADGTDYSTAIETAIANAIAALPAGANPSYDAGSNTLTFFGGGPSSLSFVVTATNDDFVESPAETIVVNLTSPTIAEGPAPTITAATATATITDIDAAVSFAVTADDEGAEGSGAAVAISEENGSDNAATFTVAMGGTPLAVGNSASVVLNFPGTAADGTDYSTAIETAIANAIAALPAGANPSYDAGSNTLTFFGGGPSSLSFVVTATNDDFVESPAETIVVNLTSPTIAEGPAPTITAATATATITDIDAADPNDFDNLGLPGDQVASDFNNVTNDVYFGGAGNDTINGTGNNDQIFGGSGNDTLKGNGGGDTIYGGSGNDDIDGSGDNDIIVGGHGADTLRGGGGSNVFRYWSVNDAGDTIVDFNPTTDSFEFRLSGFTFANQSTATTSPSVVDVSTVGTGSIAGADVVRWTGTASSMDTVAEVDALLAAQPGTFNGGALVAAYTASGAVGVYYDADANDAGGTALLATLQGITNTSQLNANDFQIIL